MFDIPEDVQGFHKCLEYCLYHICPPEEVHGVLTEFQIIWQTIWSDSTIAIFPSPYTTFIREIRKRNFPSELQVRPYAIEVERHRATQRLDKALLTPKIIRKTQILNGVQFCWLDILGNNPDPQDTNGYLSHSERASFVVAQLVLGSRFKGLAQTNEITDIKENGLVTVKGLSKTDFPDMAVVRPLNLELLPNLKDKLQTFMWLFHRCQTVCKRVFEDRQVGGNIDRQRDALNVMRKEVRRYIELVFPGMLQKGESTHLLRKIYLQLAFKKYGEGMKETGFAARVFGHSGYNTSLHYTSVIIM
jgi:hypothetical protein